MLSTLSDFLFLAVKRKYSICYVKEQFIYIYIVYIIYYIR